MLFGWKAAVMLSRKSSCCHLNWNFYKMQFTLLSQIWGLLLFKLIRVDSFRTSIVVLFHLFPNIDIVIFEHSPHPTMSSFLQLPRLYNIYKEMGIVTSFQNILDNIFLPLFEVTVDPESHPQLHVFLKKVCTLSFAELFCYTSL